jgi:ATP-dependent helicase HrpB
VYGRPVNPCPIDDILPAVKEALTIGNSLVVHAPPGAGKTTRIPLALLDAAEPDKGRIIMLEPRRLAAVSAARWMSRLLGEEVGRTVGYSIRFESRTSPGTRIEVVTEGILTRRLQADPSLEGVSLLIFDEFHERSLNSDLALALSLDARKGLRDDLGILVMSATLDCRQVAGLLGGAPVISSEGRSFEVEERYVSGQKDEPLAARVAGAVRTALRDDKGDILVFLPGAGEIRSAAAALRSCALKDAEVSIHPLYGDLPFEEQQRAIMPGNKRKVVLATNIAETSLTIEGVRVVIDSGLARRLQYNPSNGMNRLVTVSVSKASADQRKGRAGRLGPGVVYRLYSRYAYDSMQPYSPPEILLSDLASAALELAAWGVRTPSALSWLDEPPAAAWESAEALLKELGATDGAGSISETGREMARLPLHPRLAKALLKADGMGCAALGADIAALLSGRDVARRETDTTDICDSDISSRLDLLRAWRKRKRDDTGKADPSALASADRIAAQLLRAMARKGARSAEQAAGPELVSRLLLCAYPDRIAMRREGAASRFVMSGGRGVRLAGPDRLGSAPFIIVAELDAGVKGEGLAHIAAPLSEEILREECADRIVTGRRVEWDKREGRLVAILEERLGAITLSARPFAPADEEAAPVLCEAIRASLVQPSFSPEVRQLQGRVGLMRKTYPDETWPDMTDQALLSEPEQWLMPWLKGVRSAVEISKINLLPALTASLTWGQKRLLESRAPARITVPSGSLIPIDYASGYPPSLPVKLQEMFGLADTPSIADGRVKILLKLLSPAQRPLQVTQDLKGFWNSGYQQVKKEMKGRYPKHPWPDDPWNAAPTRRTKRGNG